MSLDGEGGSLNDWTLIHSDEAVENDEQRGYADAGTEELNQFQPESKIQEVEESDSPKATDGSDIERISEDGMEECSDSIISQVSHFSFIKASECRDADIESSSRGSSSGVSVLADDDNCDLSNFITSRDDEHLLTDLNVPAPRSYTHKPNRKLNIALSIVLVLSVTLVFGLGIGHFLGWSSRWTQQYSLHQIHIVKLQDLQNEMNACLQSHADNDVADKELVFCYEKVGYWKKKFQDILAENHVLQDFISKNKESVDDSIDDIEKCDEVNINMMAEYKKLKFHLIDQQLENVESLKQIEDMKRQNLEILNGMKQLEDENKILKAHIDMDEDKVDVETEDDKADELLIKQLSEENLELKKELALLTVALEMEEVDDTKAIEEIGNLRQRINSLLTENADLQQVIARLRYTEAVQNTVHPSEQNTEEMSEDSWLESTGFPDLNIFGFIDNLLKIATDKEAAKKELSQLQENLKNSYIELSKKAKEGLHTGQHILKEMHNEFESKVAALVNSNFDSSSLSTETIRQMGNTLGNAMLKLYKIGTEGMEAISTGKYDELGVTKKFGKVLRGMEKQWENMRDKMWGTSKKKSHSISGKKMTEFKGTESQSTAKPSHIPINSGNEKPNSNVVSLENGSKDSENLALNTQIDDQKENMDETNRMDNEIEEQLSYVERKGNCTLATDDWFIARAEGREFTRTLDSTQPGSWIFDRASNREKSRLSEMDPSNWYINRGKERRTVANSSSSISKKKSKKVHDDDDDDKKDKKYDKKKKNDKKKSKKSSQNKNREYKYDENYQSRKQKKSQWQKHHGQHVEWHSSDSYVSF
ncbi:hypothetical protein CHUAL_001971 [Chamberlinius hualienensis]